MKFTGVRLTVNNFEDNFDFYKHSLGLECLWGSPSDNFAGFKLSNDAGITVFRAENAEAATSNGSGYPASVIIIQVDNIYDTYRELSAKGVKFISEPEELIECGVFKAQFSDPAGNVIEIFSLK